MEFKVEMSRSGKLWKMTLGMEKSGKVMENVTADLENSLLIIPALRVSSFHD